MPRFSQRQSIAHNHQGAISVYHVTGIRSVLGLCLGVSGSCDWSRAGSVRRTWFCSQSWRWACFFRAWR